MVAGKDWEFDGTTITVHIPMKWKRRGGRKLIIAPDGSDAWVPTKPRPDETLIRALARAHRWKRMLEEGTYHSVAELAEVEKINKGYTSRILNLTLLAPDLTDSILDGRQPRGLMLEDVARGLPVEWNEQRALVACPQASAAP
jgi:hypothetical protein